MTIYIRITQKLNITTHPAITCSKLTIKTRKKNEIYSKLIIKTPERRHIFLVSLLLTLNIFHTLF